MSGDPIDWAVATMAREGGGLSGDHHVVRRTPRGALVAVVDGVGHGPEAAAAARAAARALEDGDGASPIPLLRSCHEALAPTRGAVLSLACFDVADRTMTWLGVGNVEGVLLRGDAASAPRRETLLLRPGVVGQDLPSLAAMVVPVERGDLLLFGTDGLRADFADVCDPSDPPSRLVEQIMMRYWMRTDDALVLAARYLGGES